MVKPIPKNKKCKCGKKITHHHFLCNSCWIHKNKEKKARKRAYKELEKLK